MIENANKATQISHSLEMEKLYKMQPGTMRILSSSQEASSGVDCSLPDYGASILLRATYRHPKFEKIAIDFSKRKKRCKIEDIVAAIQEQQLLLDHLKKDPERQRHADPEIKIKAAKTQQKVCFAFQKGNCTRTGCPFLHEKEQTRCKAQGSEATNWKTWEMRWLWWESLEERVQMDGRVWLLPQTRSQGVRMSREG